MTQLSKTNYKALYGSSGTTFPDNTTGDISESDLRQFGEDSADSLKFIDETVDTYYYESDEFMGPATWGTGIISNIGWSLFASGTATGQSSNYGIDNTEHALGVLECSTGAATNDYSSITKDRHTIFGTGFSFIQKFRVAHSAVSDGTDTYTSVIGFFDYVSNDFSDGAYFSYTNGTNSGNWQCVTANGGSTTITNTSVAGGNTSFSIFQISINSDASLILFLIDGVTVASHSADIPNTAVLGQTVRITKSAGTTPRLIYIDYHSMLVTRTSAR